MSGSSFTMYSYIPGVACAPSFPSYIVLLALAPCPL